jgi:lipid-binding SYLF domain-containing protein
VNLSGGVVKPDTDNNADLYGSLTPADVVLHAKVAPPLVTQPFMTALAR